MADCTILIPCSDEKYLGTTLQSIEKIYHGKYSFKLLIIVNGISTFKVQELIPDSLLKSTEILEQHEKDLVKSLNLGLKLIESKYTARIDADDVIYPNRIVQQIEFLEKNNEFWAVGGQIDLIDKNGKVIGEKKYPTTHLRVLKTVAKQSPLAHPAVTFFTEKVKGIGGYRDVLSEDYDLWLRILKFGKIANLNEKVIAYRIHENQFSGGQLQKSDKPRKDLWTNFINDNLETRSKKIFGIFPVQRIYKKIFRNVFLGNTWDQYQEEISNLIKIYKESSLVVLVTNFVLNFTKYSKLAFFRLKRELASLIIVALLFHKK